ncbi:CD3324 family protein [Bacillus solitudinis]|uniref:CD3324 family protein n=1 Tax=Bacillus solitudinis TaxID=2014074 RepID=UPI000C23E878|nr:CD3324 family protein [Bacillus solitudinis]
MKYYNTENVLPEKLITLIQEYIDGGYIYIPKKQETHKAWGEKSGTKSYLRKRNQTIFCRYQSGVSTPQLAKENYLSESSIRRIVSQEKRRASVRAQV